MPSEHDHISMRVYLLPIIIIKWGGGECITLNFSLIRYIISYRHIVVLHVHTPYIPGDNKNKHT